MSSDARRQQLIAHLEHVYALAQVITPDAEQAIAHVEQTYERAFQRLALTHDAASDKAWLFRLLLEIHDEQQHGADLPIPVADVEPDDAAEASAPTGLSDVRHRLAEDLIDRLMPAIFVTLPNSARLLLVMCDVEGLSCAEAGAVLDISSQVAMTQLAEARHKVMRSMYASMRPPERALLQDLDVEAWFKGGLTRALGHLLTPMPTMLAAQLGATVSEKTPVRARSGSARVTERPMEREREQMAPNRPQLVRRSRRMSTRVREALFAFCLIMVASFAGILGSRVLEEAPPEVDLVMLTVSYADDVEARYDAGTPEQAERWLASSLGASLTVPEITGASLAGVAIAEVAEDVEVPVLFFRDAMNDTDIRLFVYSYAQLDRFADRIQLTRDVQEQIASEDGYNLFDLGDAQVLIWRYSDEIYMAVTPSGGAELRGRLQFPS